MYTLAVTKECQSQGRGGAAQRGYLLMQLVFSVANIIRWALPLFVAYIAWKIDRYYEDLSKNASSRLS